MKKIYLLILLAVSMCFAGNVDVTTDDPYMLYNGFYITNTGNADVNGFKFYLYFNAAPVEDLSTFSADILRKRGADSYVYDRTVLPRVDPEFRRLSATQYVAVFDYSNTVIPAHGRFPVVGRPVSGYEKLAIMINGVNDKWARYQQNGTVPNILRAYVVESLSGEVLVSRRVQYRSRTSYDKVTENRHPTIDNYRRIGVLTNETSCPNDLYAGSSTPLTIKIDAENTANQTKIIQGTDYHPLGVSIPGNYIEFKFCGLGYDQLPRVPYDYIVLKLDSECPSNSYPLSRYHDAEDNNNISAYTGYIWPNIVYSSGDVKLNFCFVPKKSNATRKYPFDKKYGIFAYKTGTNISMSHIFIDDENTGNINNWDIPSVTSSYTSRIHTIMYGTDHTNYFVIKWTGTNNQMLSKSAEVEVAESPISAGQPLVAAAPFAPAIKGLNRSAVSVELKSEGKVKVSIVNANGSVIANVAQESLQPGVHQIKWNSGMVPSGRYIVKVEQNGMVNARNVILK